MGRTRPNILRVEHDAPHEAEMRSELTKRMTCVGVGAMLGVVVTCLCQVTYCCLPFAMPGTALALLARGNHPLSSHHVMNDSGKAAAGVFVGNAVAYAALSLGVSIVARRSTDRRPRATTPRCAKCGFALNGMTSGRCPECRMPFGPKSPHRPASSRSSGRVP